MTLCHDDPSFTSLLHSLLGRPITPQLRQTLYYTVCIPFRLSLFTLVALYRDSVHEVVRLVSAFTALRLASLTRGGGRQWWNREWLLLCAVMVVVVPTRIIHLPLYLSVLGGLVQSLWKCSTT